MIKSFGPPSQSSPRGEGAPNKVFHLGWVVRPSPVGEGRMGVSKYTMRLRSKLIKYQYVQPGYCGTDFYGRNRECSS